MNTEFNQKILSFTDVIKKSVLQNTFGNLSILDVVFGLAAAYVIGMIIFFVYKKSFREGFYSYSFNFSLVLMTMLTTMIIMAISSNIVLSLGMVGALSIVRFRTAIKDPLDVVFMFWAITAGISSGAGLYLISFIGSIMIAIIVLIMGNIKGRYNSYILIINYKEGVSEEIRKILNEFNYKIKSKSVKSQFIELTLEIKIVGEKVTFVEEIEQIEGVIDTVLVQYNGGYAQ